jgi:hypothetical protein
MNLIYVVRCLRTDSISRVFENIAKEVASVTLKLADDAISNLKQLIPAETESEVSRICTEPAHFNGT